MQPAINPKHLADLDRLVKASQEMLHSDFELWAAVIRSDQVLHEDVLSISRAGISTDTSKTIASSPRTSLKLLDVQA
jgi:hypothetical protein